MSNSTDDVLIIGQLKDNTLRSAIKDLVNFVDKQSGTMAEHFDNSLAKMQEAMKKFAIGQKASISLMKEAMQQYGLMFDDVWRQTTQQQQQTPKKYAPNTIGALEQELAKKKEIRREDELDSQALKQHNREIEETNEKLAKQKGLNTMAAQAKQARKEISAVLSMPANNLDQVDRKLRVLNATILSWRGKGVLDSTQWNRLQNAIDKTKMKLDKLNASAPTFKSVKAMSEKSVSDIAQKLQALRNIQVDPKNTAQVRKLGDEYQRLTRLQNELLGKGIQLTKSNNYLAQSFGYIRNRLVYAMTLGAVTSFTKQVYDIRSQYELLERSLGVLLGSFERGKQIFNELNTMALQSPFTLMELGTAAKQLTAYNFTAEEVVNTTKRLADLSAALGVPMERLTYNLGQIRAQTVLTARDARDFANAGLPIVKTLADYFSELEGRVVSTGDVFERMSKKQVSYNDVMAVLNQLTDEGGKFFDFQAKQAETLRVQMANLTLAWNNMLNEIGEANQGLLTAPIAAMKALFANWSEISHVLTEVVVGLGLYKTAQLVVNKLMGESGFVMRKSILLDKEKAAAELKREATTRKLTKTEEKAILNKKKITAADYQAILSTRELTKTQALLLIAFNQRDKELAKALVKMKLLKKAEIESINRGKALNVVWRQLWVTIKSLASSIWMFSKQIGIMLALGAAIEAIFTNSEINEKIEEINRSIVDSAKESTKSIEDFFNSYKDTIKKVRELEVFKTPSGAGTYYNPNTGGRTYKNTLGEDEAKKTWEAIVEQIKLSSAASDVFIQKLMTINDVNDRIRAGFNLLEQIHDVNGALETLDKEAIKIEGDWSKWWNLWALPDGLIENLEDYTNKLDRFYAQWQTMENAAAAKKQGNATAAEDIDDVDRMRNLFLSNLQTTTESMYNAFVSLGLTSAEQMREAFDRSNQQILKDSNLSTKKQFHYRLEAEQNFINYKMSLFDEEAKLEREAGREDRALRVEEEKKAWREAFGEGQVISQDFFAWLKNQHSSEINKLFGNMSKKEIEQINWSEPKWQKWAMDNAESFSRQYGIAFSKLKDLVSDANKWKIFLKLTISTDEKGVYNTLKDADEAANAAWTKIQRLKERQAELDKIPLFKQTQEEMDQAANLPKELAEAEKDYADALAKGGHANKAKKAGLKAQKTAEQELAEALKQELSVIRDMQSSYDKLTKAGVNSMTALNAATQGYEATLMRVNKVLSKYGLSEFDAKDFVGKDINDLLAKLEKQRSQLIASGKAKTSAIEALDLKIKEVRVEAQAYNMQQVTQSLTSELSKVKDEYEIGVAFDANPELGEVFAKALGVDLKDIEAMPRTYEQVMSKLQAKIDKELGKDVFNIKDMFGENAFNKWVEGAGQKLDDAKVNVLRKMVELVRKLFVDESKNTQKEFDDLLKKYSEFETKVKLIRDNAATARRNLIDLYGTDEEKVAANAAKRTVLTSKDEKEVEEAAKKLKSIVEAITQRNPVALPVSLAINKEEAKEQADAIFKHLIESGDYDRFFNSINTLTLDSALKIKGEIRKGIVEAFKGGALSVSQFKKEIKTLEQQFEKLTQNNQDWFVYMKDGFNGLIQKAKDSGNEIEALGAKMGKEGKVDKKDQEYLDSFGKIFWGKDGGEGGLKNFSSLMEEFGNNFEGLGKQTAAAGQNMQGAASDFQGAITIVDMIIKNIHQTVQAIGSVIDELDSMRSEDNKISNSYWQNFQKYDNYASSGWENLKSGNIGGALGDTANSFIVLYRQISKFDRNQEKINKSIKESQREVKNLELAYKDLQDAINNTYGAQKWAAQQMAQANKELQLAELKRQLQLEESRASKIRDIDKIQELKGQIKDLEIEIKNASNEIVSDLLGISSVGDAAESLVLSMVNAFRQGEKYMEEFDNAYESMINNMIAKTIASLIIGDKLQELWDSVKQKAEERAKGEKENALSIEKQLEEARNRRVIEEGKAAKEGEYTSEEEKQADLHNLEKQLEAARKIYADALKPTPDDIKDATQEMKGWRDSVQSEFLAWMDALGVEFGDQKKSNLSALQQGIQGVTEDTAGAIEAYMNILSQRVFEQGEYIAQIRDVVVGGKTDAEIDALRQVKESILGMDSDAQLGTMSLMLLQLQQSYQVQSSILLLLNNWNNASGTAIKVEMI